MIISAVVISAALQVQQINCFPLESGSTERMVISLQIPDHSNDLPNQGTLYLSSGLDDVGNQESTGILPIKLVPESDDDAAKGLVRYQARSSSAAFELSIYQKDIARTQKDFTLALELMRLSDKYRTHEEMNCYSTVFNNSTASRAQSGRTSER